MIDMDLSELNSLTYAKSFPPIPIVYIYSKTDEYISLQDSLTMYEALPSDYRCFVESGVKHNQSRANETIKFVFFRIQSIIAKKKKKQEKLKLLKKKKKNIKKSILKDDYQVDTNPNFEELKKRNRSCYNLKIPKEKPFPKITLNKMRIEKSPIRNLNDQKITNKMFQYQKKIQKNESHLNSVYTRDSQNSKRDSNQTQKRTSNQTVTRTSNTTKNSFNSSKNIAPISAQILSPVFIQKQTYISSPNIINKPQLEKIRNMVNRQSKSPSTNIYKNRSNIKELINKNVASIKKNYISSNTSINSKLKYLKNKMDKTHNHKRRQISPANSHSFNVSLQDNIVYSTKQPLHPKPLSVLKKTYLYKNSESRTINTNFYTQSGNSTNTPVYYQSNASTKSVYSQQNNVFFQPNQEYKNIYNQKFSKTILKEFH